MAVKWFALEQRRLSKIATNRINAAFDAMSFPTMVRDRMEISIANSCTITPGAGTNEKTEIG